jgi:hypothetical protein
MPNLEYDPQNPSDIFDRPIKVGDIVAWGTTWGRSPALCVARIERINFTREEGYKNVKCDQAMAERYTLTLRPIVTTGDITWIKEDGETHHEYRDGPADPAKVHAKLKTVQVVKNVCLLEAVPGV